MKQLSVFVASVYFLRRALSAGHAPAQAFEAVRPFVSPLQLACMREACAGDEGAHFKEIFMALSSRIATMPRV